MVWKIDKLQESKMLELCERDFPLESCGLFIGPVDSSGIPAKQISEIWPTTNIEKSARIYSVDPKDIYEATKYAQSKDMDIVGVYHSHTHTEAYPSPTDQNRSVDESWCYAIVSLAERDIHVRYFKMNEESIDELICETI